MQYDYFIASRWRNRDQVKELVEKIRANGKSVYSFFEAPDAVNRVHEDPEKVMESFEKLDVQNDAFVKEIFHYDMEALKNSTKLIMLLPAGNSAHVEAGTGYGLGKKCILIGTPDKTESLYHIFDETYPTIDAFITAIAE